MKGSGYRYDIEYSADGSGGKLVNHFCRVITYDSEGNEKGCFGTDPTHGYSFEEAKEQLALFFEKKATEIRLLEESDISDVY